MSWTFEATQAGYRNMWRAAAIKGGADDALANTFADRIIAGEARYRVVQAATHVPWFFVGALHMRESSCNFDGVLHNGEKIIGTGRQTTLVPAGRGPFSSWEEAAIDAMKLKDLHRIQAWTVERMLYSAEVYNGLGYTSKGVNSPYVWAGTTLEQAGKYVADHVFDRSAEDTQLGVAAVLKRLADRRADIAAVVNAVAAEDVTVMPPGEQAPQPAAGQVDLQQIVTALAPLVPVILQLLAAAGKGTAPVLPAPQPAPPQPAAAPPGTAAPAPSRLERPSVQLGVFGTLAATILQSLGVIGTPLGMGTEPTTTGTLATLLPIATGLIGATGGWGTVARIGLGVLSGLANAAVTAQKK